MDAVEQKSLRLRAFVKLHVLSPIWREKRTLAMIVMALVFLSMTQVVILVLVKGFLTAFFADPKAETLGLAALLPTALARHMHTIQDLRVSRDMLVYAIPLGIVA